MNTGRRTWMRWVTQGGLVVLASALLSSAQIPTRSAGYLVTAADWNAIVNAVNASSAAVGGITLAADLVTFSTAGTCPTGWTEYTAARGRLVVGLPSGGTSAGTVGTALTNLQDKTHTHTTASHTHTVASTASHTHGAGSYASASHTHGIGAGDDFTGLTTGDIVGPIMSRSEHAHGGVTGSAAPSLAGTSGSDSGHDHGGSVASGGSGTTSTALASAVLPYIQLIVCEKN